MPQVASDLEVLLLSIVCKLESNNRLILQV